MSVSITELVNALPVVEPDDATELEAAAGRTNAEASMRPLPLGSLRRLSLLGGLQAKIAVAYTLHWIRGWFQSAEQRELDRAETHFRAAVKLLDTMGYLRGAVMKLGQMMANCHDIAPDGLVQTLDSLHFQAPPMHFALLRETVVDELGDEPQNVFAEFDETAFAAASLGQVHRARLKSGREVAVKIQYPGIAKTIRSDFRNLVPLMLPARLTRDWENLKEQVNFLRRTIEQETDYRREAEAQTRVSKLFFEEEGVVVPRVYPEFSTEKVLTTDFLEGEHLDAFLARHPSQDERNAYSLALMRASARTLYQGRLNNMDAHQGNFLFLPDGRVGLIDFGCVIDYSPEATWSLMGRVNAAMLSGEYDCVREAMKAWQQLTDSPGDAEALDLSTRFGQWCWKPFYTEGPFNFADREYLQRGVDLVTTMMKRRCTRSHPTNLMQFRWQVGTWMMLYRLGAFMDATPIIRDESQAAGWAAPPNE